MKAYLMTRGTARRLDYDFLGASPASRWWSPLDDNGLVVLEQPEVIAHGDGEALSVLLSGVPSLRCDTIGTQIRYTLVVDEFRQDDAGLAQCLAATGLSPGRRTWLGERLDEIFDVAKVDGVLSGSLDGADVGELLAALLSSPDLAAEVTTDPQQIEGSPIGPADDWIGPADDEGARAAFLARIGALAAGDHGFAFTTHSLATRSGAAQAAAEIPGTTAILLVNGELQEVVRLGKELQEVPGRTDRRLLVGAGAIMLRAWRGRWNWRRPWRRLLGGAGAIMLLALLFALIFFL